MRRPPIDEQLAKVPLFAGLSKKHLRELSSLTSTLNVQPGRVLMREGEPGLEFMIIVEGEAEVRHGDEVIVLRGPGDFFGEIALLEDRPRTATVVASTEARIEVITRQDFRRLLADNPEVEVALEEAARRRLAELHLVDEHR